MVTNYIYTLFVHILEKALKSHNFHFFVRQLSPQKSQMYLLVQIDHSRAAGFQAHVHLRDNIGRKRGFPVREHSDRPIVQYLSLSLSLFLSFSLSLSFLRLCLFQMDEWSRGGFPVWEHSGRPIVQSVEQYFSSHLFHSDTLFQK